MIREKGRRGGAPMRAAVWALAALAASLSLAGGGPARASGVGCSAPLFAWRAGTVILNDGGRATKVRVQIADTPDRQEVGLMCRSTLDPDAGMLFMFPVSTRMSFWMKNTLIPLAIAFIDANWHIVKIIEMPVAPDPTSADASAFPLYNPQQPFRYALEVNAGFFKSHGISEHGEVRFVQEGRGPKSPYVTALP